MFHRAISKLDGDTTFEYLLFDECGDTVLFTQDIFLKPYEPMTFERDTIRVCPGDSAYLSPGLFRG